tara:strand:- start:817 stop:1245 length:429 start_codon:yes stop_codon:yes gene_type:complete
MRRIIICLAIAATTLLSAPANGAPDPNDDREYYSLRQYAVTVENRENLIAVLRFSPAKGWKWNKKYPVKLSILKPANGSRPYQLVEHHIEEAEFEKRPEVAVWMDLKPSRAAKIYRQQFTVEANYSFCNKTTCRVFKRNIKF